MRAMVYRGPYKVRVEEKEIPPIEHPSDAIVKVQLAAICGSDLHLYHGKMPDTRVGMTFVTHRIPLEHIAEGYQIFSAKLDGCIKPVVVPNAA